MNKVNREAIKALLETEDNATISLYLPTHRFPTSEHISEDKIRLKNLVRAGKDLLQARGVDEGLIEQIITEIEENYYDNESFWQQATEGLALFASPAGVHYFHLPIECDEHVSAGDQYDIAPLLAVMSCDQSYYLLALAAHAPMLYRGDMYGIDRVDIDLPESAEEALGIDELYSNSKTARAGGYGAGNPGTKSHGQGDSRQAGQEERLKFFRIIDDRIQSNADIDRNLPFLLAGIDDEVSGYRELSKLRHILEGVLSGNVTEMPPHEMHLRSWPIVSEELCESQRAEVVEKLGAMLGTGKASAGAEDIVTAAKEGRVDTLLVGLLAITRDSISNNDDPVMKLILPGDYKKANLAECSRMTFDQGGSIVTLPRDAMPEGVSIAALYRY